MKFDEQHKCHWETEQFFCSPEKSLKSITLSIKNAQKEILVSTFTLKKDHIGIQILDLLKEASQKGIKVKLLIDGFGSQDFTEQEASALSSDNFSFKIFRALPWQKKHTLFDYSFEELKNSNSRSHKKIFIIDGCAAYISTFNLCSDHFKEYAGPNAWKDSAVFVEGKEVQNLVDIFYSTWKGKSESFKRVRYLSPLIRTNVSKQLRKKYQSFLYSMLKIAKNRIYITTPYFIPDQEFVHLLIEKHREGVDIKILLPKKSDHFYFPWINSQSYNELVSVGIEVYEYLPSILHAKKIIVDNNALLGSSNLNKRSFYHDLELDVVLKKTNTVCQIVKEFKRNLKLSNKIQYFSSKKNNQPFSTAFPVFNLVKHWM